MLISLKDDNYLFIFKLAATITEHCSFIDKSVAWRWNTGGWKTIILLRYEPNDDITLSLIHVALKIRRDMIATPGHKSFSVSENEAITCVPDSLYMLLKIMFGGQDRG